MRGKVLFVINGLGMGNSTRCYALIQELHSQGFAIEVATSHNGLLFFRGRPEVNHVHAIGSIHYAKVKNKLAIAKTLLTLLSSFGIIIRNSLFLTRLIRQTHPSVVVYDSHYSLLPFVLTSVPIVALNNADRIVGTFFRMRGKPLSIYPQFFLIEVMDWLFHRALPRQVLSPWMKDSDFGLIVRWGIEPCPPTRVERIVIMLSGSSFGSEVDPLAWDLPYRTDVIGRDGKSGGAIRFHGKLVDNIALLKQADILVINAGFSAVSEALTLGKPTVVIPVENHAEQWVNAKMIEELGVGRMATQDTVGDALNQVVRDFERYRSCAAQLRLSSDGARVGAQRIRQLAETYRPNATTFEKVTPQ